MRIRVSIKPLKVESVVMYIKYKSGNRPEYPWVCIEYIMLQITCVFRYLAKWPIFYFYASVFRHRRHYVFGLSVRPSVRPSEAWNTLFWPVHGSVGPPDQPWPFYGMYVRPSVCPSVRPERFPGICRRTHGGNGLKFYMLMYLDHLQNW